METIKKFFVDGVPYKMVRQENKYRVCRDYLGTNDEYVEPITREQLFYGLEITRVSDGQN